MLKTRHITFLVFVLLLAVTSTYASSSEGDFDDDDVTDPPFSFNFEQTESTTDNSQWKWFQFKNFNVEHLNWSDFIFELYLIAGLQTWLLIYFLGRNKNQNIALGWVTANLKLFNEQFAMIGDGESGHIIYDSPADYLIWLSGRRNVNFGSGRMSLIPRQDFFKLIIDFVWGLFDYTISSTDTVEIEFEFNVNFDGFIFGVVRKGMMAQLRKQRYDLHTFIVGVKGVSDHASLPAEFAVLTESGEITDTFVTKEIIQVLANSDVAKYFNYLIISDQPSIEPEDEITSPTHTLTLSFNVPASDAKACKDPTYTSPTTPIIKVALEFLDIVPRLAHFRPEAKSKLRKAREEVNKRFTKKREQEREEMLQKKRAEKKKGQLAKLSPDEQRKHEERERKRDLKKSQKKMSSIKKA